MDGLVVHPRTTERLTLLATHMPQSLLLTGVAGVGLASIARHLAGDTLLAFLQPQNIKEQTDSEHGTISVEAIRDLYTKTRNKRTQRSVVIIDNADRMNTSAQSAFLKLLEEPNEQTYFILTSHRPQLLKATIRSRVQEFAVAAITPEQTDQLLRELNITDPTKLAQLRFIASGLPAELHRLVGDDVYFGQRAAIIGDARTLLQGQTYAKLLIAQKYHNSRDDSLQLIDSAIDIARRTLSTKPQPELVKQLEQLEHTRLQIASNGNIRLQLARFAL